MGDLSGVHHIVHLSTRTARRCEHCDRPLDNWGQDGFVAATNHYLEEHGYELLHVGQETERELSGNTLQTTVAILGRPRFAKGRVVELSPEDMQRLDRGEPVEALGERMDAVLILPKKDPLPHGDEDA